MLPVELPGDEGAHLRVVDAREGARAGALAGDDEDLGARGVGLLRGEGRPERGGRGFPDENAPEALIAGAEVFRMRGAVRGPILRVEGTRGRTDG